MTLSHDTCNQLVCIKATWWQVKQGYAKLYRHAILTRIKPSQARNTFLTPRQRAAQQIRANLLNTGTVQQLCFAKPACSPNITIVNIRPDIVKIYMTMIAVIMLFTRRDCRSKGT